MALDSDDPSSSGPDDQAPSASPGATPGVAGGGGGPATGNLPPQTAPTSAPIQQVGDEAAGSEACRFCIKILRQALVKFGIGSKQEKAIMNAMKALSHEFGQQENDDSSNKVLAAMQVMRAKGGAPGQAPNKPPGPPPSMTGAGAMPG
jgi:hypothetical protein